MPNGIKEKIKRAYIMLLRFMHRPLMKKEIDPYHAIFQEFVALSKEQEGYSILEVGSRNVSGVTRKHVFPNCEEYVGFDILEGEGVDVVGDVHKLSDAFPKGSFDFVYSVSVLEHVLFPWKAILEINKVMKVGGHVFIATHPVWPAHELPWDFWRFPANGFHALFNEYTGFELVSVTEGLPGKLYSLVRDEPTRDTCFYTVNQGVSVIARKTRDYREDLLRWELDAADVLNTMYPEKVGK